MISRYRISFALCALYPALLACSQGSGSEPSVGGAPATVGSTTNSTLGGAAGAPQGVQPTTPGQTGATGPSPAPVGGVGQTGGNGAGATGDANTGGSTSAPGSTAAMGGGAGMGGAAPGAAGSGGMGGGGTASTDVETGTGGADTAGTDTGSATTDISGTGEPDPPEPETHIYLAVGQSNMQGAAHLPDEPIFHDRVLVMQDQNCPPSDNNPYGYGEWREMFPPLIKCKEGERPDPNGVTRPIGLGPADSFAVAMAEASGEHVTIGIVGAAYGDTAIEQHLPNCSGQCLPSWGSNIDGAPVVNGTTRLYDWVVDLAKRAQETGVIKGIIFHQGENNANNPSNWLTNVNEYVTSLRNDLGLDPADCPFIAGELPHTGGSAAAMNPVIQQIPEHVENGHWVSAGPMGDGTVLGDRGDGIHWGTNSVIEMGKRYAAKMLEAQAAN